MHAYIYTYIETDYCQSLRFSIPSFSIMSSDHKSKFVIFGSGVSNFQLLLSALTTEPTARDTTISRVSFENIPRDTSISSIETNPSATSISSTEQIFRDITTPTVSINSAITESDTTDVSILPSDEEATISPDDISQDINTENDINPTAKRKSPFNLRKRPNFRPRYMKGL